MEITVRRIGRGDERSLDRVAAGVFDEPIHPERLPIYLSAPGHLMVLAFDGDTVVGQCAAVLHFHPDKVSELYIDEVGTADAYLRRGIATRMVEEMFAWARELGCGEGWLGTELDNKEANGLYLKLGGKAEHMRYYEFEL